MSIDNVGRPFAVRAERRDGTVVLGFLGELDLSGRDEAAATLADAVTDGARVVLVNLQGLSFMDSTGLHCLFEAKLLADAAGARIAIVNGSGACHRLLELAGMDSIIEMVNDPAQLDQPAAGP